MARARTIKPGFFKSEQLAACSSDARLLFAGLWTIADRAGRLEYRPLRIKAELFPYHAVDIEKLVAELEEQELLLRYTATKITFVQITGFTKHQRPHPKEPPSEIPEPAYVSTVSDKAVEKNGETLSGSNKETAGCAFPSSNPLILQSSNPLTGAPHPEPQDSDLEAFLDSWNSSEGNRKARLPVSSARKRAIRIRIRDPAWDWKAALAKFPLKCLETGGWIPELDWFLKPDTVTKILEGKYDWTKGHEPTKQRVGAGQRYIGDC